MKHTQATKEKCRIAALKQHAKGKAVIARGWHHTEKAKKIIREKRKLQIFSQETLDKRGKSLSLARTGKRYPNASLAVLGKNNPGWKGGVSKESHKIRTSIQYDLWRQAIFARDGWTCQKSKVVGDPLVAHHINNFAEFPELRFAIDNGITLSKKEHKKFHKKYGSRKNTKEQLEEFINH